MDRGVNGSGIERFSGTHPYFGPVQLDTPNNLRRVTMSLSGNAAAAARNNLTIPVVTCTIGLGSYGELAFPTGDVGFDGTTLAGPALEYGAFAGFAEAGDGVGGRSHGALREGLPGGGSFPVEARGAFGKEENRKEGQGKETLQAFHSSRLDGAVLAAAEEE